MDHEKVLGEHKFPTYEELKTGLIRLIDEGKISREDAARVLPELRESEDERVAKAIDEIMKLSRTWGIAARYGLTAGDIRRWVKKQKEQKPALSEVELLFRGEKVTVKRPFYRDNKGRGYSTAELDEGVAWNALRAWCEKKGISLYDLYPKAEWSEDDKNMWTHLNGYLNGFSCSEDAIKQMADWFYELPNRFNPQPKQEWSEEDDNKIESIKGLITTGRFADTNTVRTIWKLLDSIHPRPSWKPSEELLDALYIVANLPELEFYGGIKDKIRELYKQLKRIK